jgi:competence protein ComEC
VWRFPAALLAGARHPLRALAAAHGETFLWLPVWLALGIGGYFLLPAEPETGAYALAVALAGIAALIWVRGPEAAKLPAAAVVVISAGFVLAGARAHQVAAPVLSYRYYGPIEGRIVAIDRSSGDYIRLTLDRVVLENTPPARTPATVRVALHGDQSQLVPEPGLRVMLTGHLSPPAGPASPQSYDFRRNSWFAQLGAVGYVRAPVMVAAPPATGDWLLTGHRARMRISAAIQARIPGQAGAVASALMTGDRSGISEATNASMRASNLYHIISISGLHMGMLAGFVFAAVRYGLAASGGLALRLPTKKIAAGVALLAASIYLWLAGANVATERAYVMAATMLVAVLADRRAISLRTVAVAALILLLMEPESLVEPGFQMSFGATVALILIYRPWAAVEQHVPWLMKPVAMLVVSSLAAGLSTAPIAAAHFNRMAEYGLLANLLVVPVMGTLVMPAGVIAALLAPFGLAGPALWVMQQGTAWMIYVSDWVAGLDGALIAVAAPPPLVLPLLACGAALAVLARGAARSVGLIGVVAATLLWQGEDRPALLIAPEGELVGLLAAGGRALSKGGADFVATTWLAEDGDTASPDAAFARAGWSGPAGTREAMLDGHRVVHLTGKGAADRVADACRAGAIVVISVTVAAPPDGGCTVFDLSRLRATGSVAITARDGGLQIWTAADAVGTRLWAGAARPR